MKRVRFLTAALCTLLLLTILTVPALAADGVEYWEKDADDYFFYAGVHKLSTPRMERLALYLREINVYSGFETYIVTRIPEDQADYANWARQLFDEQKFGKNAIVLFFNNATKEAAVICGEDVSAVLASEQQQEIKDSLLASTNDTAPDIRFGLALTKLIQNVFGSGNYAVPGASFLNTVLGSGAVSSEVLENTDSIETNGLLNAQQTVQLDYLIYRRRTTLSRVLILPDGTEESVLAEVERILLELQQQNAASTSVYVYALESRILGREPGTAHTLSTDSESSFDALKEYLLSPNGGSATSSNQMPRKASPYLGFIITISVVSLLLLGFFIALHFHKQTKERKHLPRMPRGLDVNAGYPHFVESIESQKPSEQTNKQR